MIQPNAIDPVQAVPTRHRWSDWAATLGLFGLLFLLWTALAALVSKALKEPPPSFNPNAPRLFPISAIGETAKPQLDSSTLDQLADSISYFLNARPSKRLDVVATIKATGRNAGMPDLRFHRQKQVRRICIFEDARSEPLVWNSVTSELMEGLSKRGVDVLYGQFAGGLNQFRMRDGATYWLEDLDNEKRDSIFLFFSDGKQIHNRRDVFALERLAKLPLVAWFDFREPRFWDETALLIKTYGIPLYQANAGGLKRAFDRFLKESGAENDDSKAVSRWRGFPPFTDGQLAVYVEHLLGDALVWAQACAMLQPLSLKMAHALRCRFQPHLPAERIERLFRLPGTTWQASCLVFSRPVLAALRGGFTARLSRREQGAVLGFIQQQIRLLEPPKKEKSLRRLAWEWTLRRVQLESMPDEALPVLSQLAQTPLGSEIKRDLSHLVFVDQPATSAGGWVPVPLRARPFTKKGIAYLRELSPQTAMGDNLPQSIALTWRRLQFIIKRVWKYAWQRQVRFWEGVGVFLRLKAAESPAPGLRASQAGVLADPPELKIKRLFARQRKTLALTLKTHDDDWLVGSIATDNEWLTVAPSHCDGQGSRKTVSVVVDAGKLMPGDHASNITFHPANDSEPLDVPVSVKVYRSWQELGIDWWRKHRPKRPVRTAVALVLLLSAVTFVTFKLLPENWPNRIYNRPPVLHSIRVKPGEDLPNDMLALEAVAEDADGDALQYRWQADSAKVAVDGADPILIEAGDDSINLTLSLEDSRGGYSNYSTIIRLGDGFYYSYYDIGSFDYPDARLLLTNLKNGSLWERWVAARSLAYVELQREKIAPELVSSLSDPNPEVLQAVMYSLSRFEKHARPAVPAIVGHLKSEHDDVRIAAAEALARFSDDHQQTVPALLEALKDENEAVGQQAARSLGAIGPAAKSSLVQLLNGPSDASRSAPRVRRLAAEALGKAGVELTETGLRVDSNVMSALLGVLKATGNDVELRRTVAYTIARLEPSDAETARSLVPHVKDRSPRVRSAVVSALWSALSQGNQESSIAHALSEAMKDENAEVRRTAISALAGRNPEVEDFESKLIEALKDGDADVRRVAAATLSKRDDNRGVDARLIALLKDPSAQRAGAAEALALIEVNDTAAAVEALKPLLVPGDTELRRSAGYAMATIATKDERATEALIEYLNDKDPHLKNAAISAIWGVRGKNLPQGVVKQKEAAITEALIAALRDESPLVRKHAATALGTFQKADAASISALTNVVLNDADGDVAIAALRALDVSDLAFCQRWPEFLRSRFADVRQLVVRKLVSDSPGCQRYQQEGTLQLRETLLDLMDDDDPLVRSMAISAFNPRRLPIDSPFYRAYFQDEDRGLLYDPYVLFAKGTQLLTHRNFAVRISAMDVLAPLENPEVVSTLSRVLRDDQDPRVRRAAAFAIGRTGNPEAEPLLEAAKRDSEDPRVYYAACSALLYLKYFGTGVFSENDWQVLEDVVKNGDRASFEFVRHIVRRLELYLDYEPWYGTQDLEFGGVTDQKRSAFLDAWREKRSTLMEEYRRRSGDFW